MVDPIIDELEDINPNIKCGYVSTAIDIFRADTIITCGEGDFPKRLLWVIRIFKKPLILYHVSPDNVFFNNFAKRSKWVVPSRAVSGFDYFPSPVLISDLATPRHVERIWNRERLVSKRGCIGIIGLVLEEAQLQKLQDALTLLIEDLDLNIVFIPILKGESIDNINIRYSANTRYVKTHRYSSREILSIVSKIDLLISTTEEGIICAMAMDRPVIGIVMDDELDNLLVGIDEEVLFDIDKLSCDDLYSKIKIAWVHRDTIAKQMQDRVVELKKKASEGIRRLAKWISQ